MLGLTLSSIEVEIITRLVVAVILGACMGLERSLAGKHAGMRTYALVSLGSALFTVAGLVASYQLTSFTGVNPLQIAASIVIGIGFIGSGLALRTEHAAEITTASGIWLVAAVGMAAGFGYYAVALASTVLGLLVFTILSKLENRLRRRYGKAE